MSKFFIDKKITKQLMDLIQDGELPWQKPWNLLTHTRLKTGSKYRGINPFILSLSQAKNNFTSNFWLTKTDAKNWGNCIRKEEFKNSTIIVFFTVQKKENEAGEEYDSPILRYYQVWNIDQCEISEKMQKLIDKRTPKKLEFKPIEKAESLIDLYKDKPEVKEIAQDRAYYSPVPDEICLPKKEQFKTIENYYATYFHELAHSTGHKNRLNRFNGKYTNKFGDCDYSFEELVAEFTSAFCASACGIKNTIENSAAYIRGWQKSLNDNPDWLRKAASKANQAFDYMQGIRY